MCIHTKLAFSLDALVSYQDYAVKGFDRKGTTDAIVPINFEKDGKKAPISLRIFQDETQDKHPWVEIPNTFLAV